MKFKVYTPVNIPETCPSHDEPLIIEGAYVRANDNGDLMLFDYEDKPIAAFASCQWAACVPVEEVTP